ncbi:hypothetical protein [Brevibacterium sp. HMSC07C04]|uniref:hypothetical protein n=1 Tax=Brevibacterium sp. HMSC07C04 TaxID=1581130 RepID=UPI00114C93AF|nr:hypothetical protein [Brevibacterium sp. HMSC07C04]
MAEDIIPVRRFSDQRCLCGVQIRLHLTPRSIAQFCIRTRSQINRRLIRELPKVPMSRTQSHNRIDPAVQAFNATRNG